MITKGDYLGIGNSKGNLQLFAVVDRIDEEWVTAWVINGCWTLKFDHGLSYFEIVDRNEPLSGKPVLLAVVPADQMPKFGHYQEGFDLMEDIIWEGRHRVRYFWMRVFAPISRMKLAFKATRLGRAIQAFNAEWSRHGKKAALPAPVEPEDDEISF